MSSETIKVFLAYLLSRIREPYVRRLTATVFLLQGLAVGGYLMWEHTYFSGIDLTPVSHEWYGLAYLALNLIAWYIISPKDKATKSL